MSIKAGMIGTGAAGNQTILEALASKVEKDDLLAINSSDIDLKPLKDKVDTILLGGKGCGKDRAIAERTLKKYIKPHADKFTKFKSYDIVYLVGSAGGGTNSGMMAGIAKILRLKYNIKVGIMLILPKLTESLAAQYNTLACVKEIKELCEELSIPYTFYDNNLVEGNTIETFSKINKCIVEDFKILRGDLNDYSPYGIIDEMDNLKLVYQPGLFKLGKLSGIKENYLDKQSLPDSIVNCVNKSLNVDIERDRVVARIGLYLNLNDQLLSTFNKDSMGFQEKLGKPKAIYDQLNIIEEGELGAMAILLTGLSFPDTRINEISTLIAESKEQLTKETESKVDEMYESVNWFDDTDDDFVEEDEDDHDDNAVDIDDII